MATKRRSRHADLARATTYAPTVLTAEVMRWLAALTDAIIPRAETPGASDAGVPTFIDRTLAAHPDRAAALERFETGIAAIDAVSRDHSGERFDSLNPRQQFEVLTAIIQHPASLAAQFFTAIRNHTVDGYYTSREGLAIELGWSVKAARAPFVPCDHPEHQE